LLRAWRRRSTLRDSGSRKQWLSTIVRNEAFRHYSRPRADPTDEIEQLESQDEELVVATVDRADLQAALGRLSERERAVLELMASGATNPEIGEALHLSRHTVKEHSSAVYRKLEVRNRRAYVT